MDSTQSIIISSLNTRGAISNIVYIDQLCSSSDIVCLQEHHLFDHNISVLSTLSPNYRVFARCQSHIRNDGVAIRKGGLAIMWKTGINHTISKLHDVGDVNIMGVKISNGNSNDIYLFNVYLPCTNYCFDEYANCVNTMINIYEYYKNHGSIIFIGDMNTSLIVGKRALPNDNNLRRTIFMQKFLDDNNLISLVTQDICTGPKCTYCPIYGNGSQIDHIIIDTCNVTQVVECCVHDDDCSNTSDHNALSLYLSFSTQICVNKARQVYKWHKANVNQYATLLDQELCKYNMTGFNIDNANDLNIYCDKLVDIITNVSDVCIPKTKYCSYLKPYWSSEIKLLHKEQKRLRLLWIHNGRPRGPNYDSYVKYKLSKQLFATALKTAADEYEQNKYDDMCDANDFDVKKFWNYINKRRKCKTNDFHVINDGGKEYCTPESQFHMWIEHFKALLNENETENSNVVPDDIKLVHERIDDEIKQIREVSSRNRSPIHVDMSKFTVEEINNICGKLPKGKAPGIDLLTYEHFIYSESILIECIVMLFNAIINLVKIPYCFKRGLLFVLYKGHGKPKNLKNSYRGVTLLPVLNKLFEKCLIVRMEKLFKYHMFPPTLQHACRKKSSNVTLSYAIQEAINYHTEHNGKVFACFLDISQAFDKVTWKGLLYKMYNTGITDKLWLLFYDWFHGSTCSLFFNGELSNDFAITRSIKQGGVFSMYAFCIMFSDVHQHVDEHKRYGLYYRDIYIGSPALADDLTLLSSTKTGLDTMMQNAMRYSLMWKLTFSSSKTKCMVFGESKRTNAVNKQKRQFNLGNTVIEEVDHYTHIGIELCSYLSSKQCITNMCNKGNRVLAGLTAIGVRTNNVIPPISLSVWRKIGLTSMLHGAETWWNLTKLEINMLEKTQCSILKAIQNLSLRTHNDVVRSMIGQGCIQGNIDRCKLRFFSQLTMLDSTHLAYQIFTCRLFDWVFGNYNTGYIPNVYSIFAKYCLQDYFLNYVHGIGLPEKICWKMLIKEHINEYECHKTIDNLLDKNDVHRYLRVYNGDKHIFYSIMKRHKCYKSNLLAMLKLLTIPIFDKEEICVSCCKMYDDIVRHSIAECSIYIKERNELWDIIINILDVHSSVELFNASDDDIIDILLGKHWYKLSTQGNSDIFYTTVSSAVVKFIPNVCMNIPWYRM